jgi:dihydrofolate reductase
MAMDKNGTIGNGIELPWKGDVDTKWDMANFKKLTTNHIVIMGYNTYKGFNKPLKNRLNLVIGRVSKNDKFYSVKPKKSVPNNPNLYIACPPGSKEYEYYSNLDNAKFITDKDELKTFLDYYWGLCEHIEGENANNENVNELKVDMTKDSLAQLYSYILVKDTDKRFVFVDKSLFGMYIEEQQKNKHDFDTLNTVYNAIKNIEAHMPSVKDENETQEECEANHKKILEFDPSEAYIIGGAKTYEQLIGYIDEFILTIFDKEYEGDIKFNKSLLDKFSKSEVLEEHENGKIIRYYN